MHALGFAVIVLFVLGQTFKCNFLKFVIDDRLSDTTQGFTCCISSLYSIMYVYGLSETMVKLKETLKSICGGK